MFKHAAFVFFVSALALAGCDGCSKSPDPTAASTDSGATTLNTTTAAPTTPPSAASATPASAAKSGDHACEKDDDCVPVRAPACCPQSCPFGVVNKRDRDKIESDVAIACGKQPPHACPAVSACRTNALLCENKKCGIFYEGDPGYRARKP